MKEVSASHATLAMPRLGETMDHGVVSAWLVKVGESFRRGDAIIEFETDKTAVELPALGDGVLMQQLVNTGDQVKVGQPIALIDIGEGIDWVSGGSDDAVVDSPSSLVFATERSSVDVHQADDNALIRATPVARKLARQSGISLSSLTGSGRRSRIEAHDVEAYVVTTSLYARGGDNTSTKGAERGLGDSTARYVDGIAYRASGKESGARYLLVHGFAADASAWSLLNSALVRAGCRVVVVDLPGHGATLKEAQDLEPMSDALQAVLSANTTDRRPWHVVAHSLGAVPALALARSLVDAAKTEKRRIPEIARSTGNTNVIVGELSLIAPIGLGLSIDTSFIKGMATPASEAELTSLLRQLSDRPSTLPKKAITQMFNQLEQGRLAGLAGSVVGEQGQRVDILEAIRMLSSELPIRIIIGHADRIIRWQDTMHVSPLVSVHHFPAAGHMPHWDHPAEVAEILLFSQ